MVHINIAWYFLWYFFASSSFFWVTFNCSESVDKKLTCAFHAFLIAGAHLSPKPLTTHLQRERGRATEREREEEGGRERDNQCKWAESVAKPLHWFLFLQPAFGATLAEYSYDLWHIYVNLWFFRLSVQAEAQAAPAAPAAAVKCPTGATSRAAAEAAAASAAGAVAEQLVRAWFIITRAAGKSHREPWLKEPHGEARCHLAFSARQDIFMRHLYRLFTHLMNSFTTCIHYNIYQKATGIFYAFLISLSIFGFSINVILLQMLLQSSIDSLTCIYKINSRTASLDHY